MNMVLTFNTWPKLEPYCLICNGSFITDTNSICLVLDLKCFKTLFPPSFEFCFVNYLHLKQHKSNFKMKIFNYSFSDHLLEVFILVKRG